MRVLFQCEQLSYRGTTNSIYDYAQYNQEILGNESAIVYSVSNPAGIDTGSIESVVTDFKDKFQVMAYGSHEELDNIASNFDFCYSQRAGLRHNMESKEIHPVVTSTNFGVHSVFQWYDPHGDVYAYISEYLSNEIAKVHNLLSTPPFVPYIVNLPDPQIDLKERLGVPKDKFVFGRHGGFNTFDIPFVQDAIRRIVHEHDDIIFLFLNTEQFYSHPNIMYVEPFFDKGMMSNYITACDAMLHGRTLGESFGLSIAEFLFHNKPVLAWEGGFDRNHIQMLENYNLLYNEQNCYDMIVNMRDRPLQDYKKIVEPFTPVNVMNKFNEVFLNA